MSNNLVWENLKRSRVSKVSGSLRSGRAVIVPVAEASIQDQSNPRELAISANPVSSPAPPTSVPPGVLLYQGYRSSYTTLPSTMVNTTLTFSISFGSIL